MKSIAVAESLTGGAVGAAITSKAGASEYFLGGIIAYSNSAKVDLLGVDPEVIEIYGAVSRETAVAMATGVRNTFGSDLGLATTGVAGPDTSEGKPVGTVFIAVVGEGFSEVKELALTGDRDQIRAQTTAAALALLASPQAG